MQDSDLHRKQIEEASIVQQIQSSEGSEHVVKTILKTDERVIARVTDGIYRQPASALRELISNAYDADATRVVIKTDAPRFDKISIEDNGLGMTPEALTHMLLHIGGSAKRQLIGKDLGITDKKDPTLSPSGRKLIGKIGIGIFSVSQLTHKFQIITKVKGDKYRTVATVVLKQYSDDNPISATNEYESGKVNIWREKATDNDAQGTTIVLTNIKPQARDTLMSKDIWSGLEDADDDNVSNEPRLIEPPKFHIGRVDSTGQNLKKTNGALSNMPWQSSDSPEQAFDKLVHSVWDEILHSNPNPQLEKLFDYYLQMAWQLSLALPIPYVRGHLFDMDLSGWAETYLLSNERKGQAKHVELTKGKIIRDVLGLEDGKKISTFDVFFDDLKLSRPIKYKGMPAASHSIKKPLIFIGRCQESFKGYPIEVTGGPLEFEAYLFWTPKVAPTEHRGVLVRINGASGTLFDPSFMNYQVSEQTRTRQTTCEIFIRKGFDSALNIDRESFNFSHPHAVYITRWLHGALRQLATAQKKYANEIRVAERNESQTQTLTNLQQIAEDLWKEETKDVASQPPSIVFDDNNSQQGKLIEDADMRFNRASIVQNKRPKTVSAAQSIILDEKLKAIVQVLASFNLLDNLSKTKQERLLKAIYQIIETTE